jgi:4-carboxymuconolactone decarboxylase
LTLETDARSAKVSDATLVGWLETKAAPQGERVMTATPTSVTPAEPSVLDVVGGVIPKVVEISRNVIFGEIWERPGLSKRDRSLITVATLLGLGSDEMHVRGHLARALQNGVSKEEISELLTHLAFYVGWPAVMTAALLAKDVFEKD